MSTCVLTVGSTSFPALVAAGLSASVVDALGRRGISTYIVQHGRSSVVVDAKARSSVMDIQLHPFLGDIEARIQAASVVISHAGAGSILAAVRCHSSHKPALIVVPNETLMDNHQAELAAELRAKNWAVVAEANEDSLAAAIDSLDRDPAKSATAFPAFDPKRFPAIIDAHMGYK